MKQTDIHAKLASCWRKFHERKYTDDTIYISLRFINVTCISSWIVMKCTIPQSKNHLSFKRKENSDLRKAIYSKKSISITL